MIRAGEPTPGVFRPPVAFEALDLRPFAALPALARSPELLFLDHLVDAVVDAHCLRIAGQLGGATAAAAGRQPARQWLGRRLEDAAGRTGWPARALEEAVDSVRDHAGSTFDLLDTAAAQWPAFLHGEIDGDAVLLGAAARPLWERYFDDTNLAYAPINHMVAAALERARPDGQLRVLEVGAGLGSASRCVLERLGDGVADYRCTEIAPWFLAKAKVALTRSYPAAPLSFARVDLDRPLAAQGIEPASADAVVAVNVLHAVRDLDRTLGELRAVLRPGGVLALGETIRSAPDRPLAIELVFHLLRGFRDIVTDPELRPSGGFLFHRHWPALLRRAGFAAVRCEPDLEAAIAAYPTYSLAAIVAERA